MSLWADASTREALAASLGAWPSHALTPDQTALLLRLLDGVYAPLDAFPHQSGPTALVIAASTAARLAAPGPLVLREAEGRAVAVMREATAWQDAVGWHAAGRVVGLQPPPAYDFVDLRLSPDAVRAEIARRGWRDAAAVFADFPFHRAEIAELGRLLGGGPLAFSDEGQPIVRHDLDGIGLVVFASVVAAQAPDTAVYARVRALRAALAHLGSEHVLFVYDGRPEADGAPGSPADATIARAFGCGRLVTWRTPSPALVAAAREAVVAIEHLPAGVPAPLDESPEGRDRWTFPEVAAELARGAPATLPGVTVFFTGLSGSGKSTIANALRVRLLEEGLRTVTLLDGDLVRQHLSSELGFSREHRNLNVRRIAFVAAEITRHGGFAICAPIAPYAAVRHEARAMVERVGTFLLVYVATPLAVCEARDPKGLYQRARAGTLPEFTGVSDPYEVPEDADITLDTSRLSVAASVEVLMAALTERRLLGSATATPRAARDAAPGGASS